MKPDLQSIARSLESQVLADCALRGIVPVPLAVAPSTLDALREAMASYPTGRIPVWAGGSSRTVFSGAAANNRFRAHHDAAHLDADAPMTLAGEYVAFTEQAKRIAGRWERHLLGIEILGQAAYRARHGTFPDNQEAFTRHAWARGLTVAVERGGF